MITPLKISGCKFAMDVHFKSIILSAACLQLSLRRRYELPHASTKCTSFDLLKTLAEDAIHRQRAPISLKDATTSFAFPSSSLGSTSRSINKSISDFATGRRSSSSTRHRSAGPSPASSAGYLWMRYLKPFSSVTTTPTWSDPKRIETGRISSSGRSHNSAPTTFRKSTTLSSSEQMAVKERSSSVSCRKARCSRRPT